MKRKVLIHAGFHKTGTSSVQRFLRQNRRAIWPRAALALPSRIPDVLGATKAYSKWQNPAELPRLTAAFCAFLETLDLGEKRGLCISAENLSGLMPGRPEVDDYSAAPPLMRALAQAVEQTIGGDVDLCFYFSTRAPKAWFLSAWQHNLRTTRLTDGLDEFTQRTQNAANWPHILAEVSRAVAPHQIRSSDLNDTAALALGPAAPIIDFLGFPAHIRRQLRPVPPQNTALPWGIVEQFLALNQSRQSDADVQAAKDQILQTHKAGVNG